METLSVLIIIAIHVYTLYDAIKNIRTRLGAFRVALAFFPPVIGPFIYFLTKSSLTRMKSKRGFMEGKERY